MFHFPSFAPATKCQISDLKKVLLKKDVLFFEWLGSNFRLTMTIVFRPKNQCKVVGPDLSCDIVSSLKFLNEECSCLPLVL